MELKKKRTYNSKTFQVTPTKCEQKISAGIIHYENSQRLVGDGVGGLRDIDKSWIKGIVEEVPDKVWNEETQEFDEIQTIPNLNKECYYYDFANDPVRAGLKANELIRYIDYFNNRAYSTAFIPQCNSVDGVIDGKDLIYNHAFNTGQDLVLRTTNLSLQKLVRLRDYSIQDYTFDFEIIIENYTAKNLSIFRVDQTGQNETYSIDLMSLFAQPKVFDNPNRITVIGQTENDGTIIKPPKAWYFKDAERFEIDIQTELFGDANTGKFYLRKHIPSQFLQDANGEVVYTDTETTINVSNYIYRLTSSSGASYNAAQTLTSWNHRVQRTSSTQTIVGADTSKYSNIFYDGVGAFGFLISSLSGVTVSSATLQIKEDQGTNPIIADDFNGDVSGDDCYYATSIDSIDITNITAGDKANWQKRIISNAVDATLTNGEVTRYNLDSTGISELQTKITNSENYYGLIVATGFGINETTPTNTGNNIGQYYFYNDYDGAHPPQLIVTYDVGTVTSVTSDSSYSGAVVRLTNTSWNDAYTGAGYNALTSGAEMHRIMAKYRSVDGSDWAIHRVLLTFDISNFNTSDTINNAVLFAKAEKFMDTGTDHNDKRYLQILKNTKPTPNSTVTTSDYQSFDDTNLYSGKSYTNTYLVNNWVAIQLNTNGISDLQSAIINGESHITLNIHTGFDIENINPNNGNRQSIEFYGSDDAGNEPYIEIDYTSGGGGTVASERTYKGKPINVIQSIKGKSIYSIQAYNGKVL